MTGIFLGIVISFSVLFFGIVGFVFLVKRYKDKLLVNFSQKIGMTFWLAMIFGSFFLLGNAFLAYFLPLINFSNYQENLGMFIRIGLLFFVMNSFLILSVRSLIKSLSNL